MAENFLQQATAKMLASYEQLGGINHLSGAPLPSKHKIAEFCAELLGLLFPGFHSSNSIICSQLEPITNGKIANINAMLTSEIHPECGGGKKVAALICEKFFLELPAIRELIYSDVQAAFDGDPAAKSLEEIVLAYPCIEAIAIQRMAHFFYHNGCSLTARIMTEWAHARTGIDIHPGAQIGASFFIDHGTGVVIGETCQIGSGVKLYHGVTLGARSFPRDEHGKIRKGGKRHPTIENEVVIYPGATILGGDTIIGHHSTIGANVFIMQSIAPYTLIAFEPTGNRIHDKLANQNGENYSI